MSDNVECARCGVTVPTEWAFVEEGDEWECPRCWHRCEEKELHDEIERLSQRLAELERDADELLKERDHVEDVADKLADAIATLLGVDIGEHSSGNCPWTAALEAFEQRAADSATVTTGEPK